LKKEILIPGIAMLVIGLAMVGYTFLIPVGATGTLAMVTILYIGGTNLGWNYIDYYRCN
jgi:hypothetical protein